MFRLPLVGGALVLLAGLFLAAPTQADYGSSSQYYGGWHQHKNYYYRTYYYKPRPTYAGYRHHYVVYHPQRPNHYYYYNPYRKVYWGRCPVDSHGEEAYSHLAEGDQRGNLEEIKESAFPAPGKMPLIPESDAKQNQRMDLPPDDLPQVTGLPLAPDQK
jgi:hypothetical protein